jgi:Galactose oxidase, central domain
MESMLSLVLPRCLVGVSRCFAHVVAALGALGMWCGTASGQAGWRWIQTGPCLPGKAIYESATDSMVLPRSYYSGQNATSVNYYIFMLTSITHEREVLACGNWLRSGPFQQSATHASPAGGEFGTNNGCNCPSWSLGLPHYYLNTTTGRVNSVSWDYGVYVPPGGPQFNRAMRHQELVAGSYQTTVTDPIASVDIDGPLFHSSLTGDLLRPLGDGNILAWSAGSAWRTLQPLVVPPGVPTGFIVHDTVRHRLVVPMLAQSQPTLWEYDIGLNMWFERIGSVPASFARRDNYCLGFHPPSGNVIIYGGRDANGVILGDVWHYDGQSIYQAVVGASPARREGAVMVYRNATQEMIMWGGGNGAGLRDTWAYTPGSTTVAYSFYGSGCPGSAGTPYLDLNPGVLPFSGQRFSVLVKRLPFFAPTFLMVGGSDQNHLGLPLPYSLASLGMPGCNLLTGPDEVYPCTNVFGTALWDVQIPPGLGGQTFFNQAVIFDSGANSMGVSLSNGGRALVGY